MLLGNRAAFRRCVHAQSGRGDDAGRERRLRRDRQVGRLVLRRAHGEDRQARTHSLRRSPREMAASVRDRARHNAGVARQDAGRISGELRLGHFKDHELPAHRVARRRACDLRACVRSQVQGRHGIS